MQALNVKVGFIISLMLKVVLLEPDVFISLLSGEDTTSCGTEAFPCRTISYAIHRLPEGSIIYLDGRGTSWQRHYKCRPFTTEHKGIYLTKNTSFFSSGSRAHISCTRGNSWLVNGSRDKRGIQVNFKGLAFRNSSLHFLDASVNIKDCTFHETREMALNFSAVKQTLFELTLDNVLFQQNGACLRVESNKTTKSNVFIKIKDSVFQSNGQANVTTSSSSVLSSSFYNDNVNMEIRNASFVKNSLPKNGMIFVNNELGKTHVLLKELQLHENGYQNIKSSTSLFLFNASYMILKIEFCFVSKTFGRLLHYVGQSVQMNVSNTEVDGFRINRHLGGGVLNIYAKNRCHILLLNSNFRNGEDSKIRRGRQVNGGAVLIFAPSGTVITLKNSTIQNVSNLNVLSWGGALFVAVADSETYSSARVELNIFASSFSYNLARRGGAISVLGPILLTVINSTFLRNTALEGGGSWYLSFGSDSVIQIRNVSFVENNAAESGGAILVLNEPNFSFFAINVVFIRNTAGSVGAISMAYNWPNPTLVLSKVRFIENAAKQSGSSIVIKHYSVDLASLVLNECVFQGNTGLYGTVFLRGRYRLNCQNSMFSSNVASTACGGLSLEVKNSAINISNSTFVNNSCRWAYGGAVLFEAITNSTIFVTDSIFINNTALDSTGGAISVLASTDQINRTDCWNHRNPRSWIYLNSLVFERVHFQGNIATSGSAMYITNSLVIMRDCTFLDNFGFASGSQLVSYGSASLEIYNSSFMQTIGETSLNKKKYVFSSFLEMDSAGPLVVHNTTVRQTVTSNQPLIVVSKTGLVNIDNSSIIACPLGSSLINSDYSYMNNELLGCAVSVTVIRVFCQQCNPKYYSLQTGQSKGLNIEKSFMCIPCPYGAECFPAIKSKDNFWGYKSDSYPPTLSFTRCPADYCKSPGRAARGYNACQGKRTGVMCGACSHGYAETLLSNHCKLAKDCKPNGFWIAFIVLVFIVALFLIFKPPVITFLVKQVLWFKMFSRRRSSANPQGLENRIWVMSSAEVPVNNRSSRYSYSVEIIIYFYQISQLFMSSFATEEYPETRILPSLLAFFNVQFTVAENACPFAGLMPHTKKLFKVVPILATMSMIYFLFAMHCLISRIRHDPIPSFAPYLAASVRTLFLSYTVLATVSIQLIRCVFIDGETRWFYNGNLACYQWWQYAAFVFNAVFVIPFIFILAWASFKLHNEAVTARQLILGFILPLPSLVLWLFSARGNAMIYIEPSNNLEVLKEMLLGPFRQPEALYWKSFMIFRRFLLVLLSCVITETSFKLFWMTLVCLLALFHHLRVKPFKHDWANNLESVSLLSLVVLGFISQYKSVILQAECPQTDSMEVLKWLEIVILGLFPASIFLLFLFTMISLLARFLYVCCGSLFRRCFRPETCHRVRLLDACENVRNESDLPDAAGW